MKSNGLIYWQKIFFTLETSVAQTVRWVRLLIPKENFAVGKIPRLR
jgi:hypothetical protein